MVEHALFSPKVKRSMIISNKQGIYEFPKELSSDLRFADRSTLFHIKTRVCLKYFVNDCLWKQFLASKLAQTPSNFFFLTIFKN